MQNQQPRQRRVKNSHQIAFEIAYFTLIIMCTVWEDFSTALLEHKWVKKEKAIINN